MDLKDILIIVSEIDGIITDGSCPIDYMNHTIFKSYYDRDFEAINELKTLFTFVFLSDDSAVSYNVMRNRNIPAFFSSSKESKLHVLTQKIMPRYNMTPDNLLYVGNKLSDIPCLNFAEIGITLTNSYSKLINISNHHLVTAPGKGVLCELYEFLYLEMENRIRRT